MPQLPAFIASESSWIGQAGPYVAAAAAAVTAWFRFRPGSKKVKDDQSVGLATLHSVALKEILDRQDAEIMRLKVDNAKLQIENNQLKAFIAEHQLNHNAES